MDAPHTYVGGWAFSLCRVREGDWSLGFHDLVKVVFSLFLFILTREYQLSSAVNCYFKIETK